MTYANTEHSPDSSYLDMFQVSESTLKMLREGTKFQEVQLRTGTEMIETWKPTLYLACQISTPSMISITKY